MMADCGVCQHCGPGLRDTHRDAVEQGAYSPHSSVRGPHCAKIGAAHLATSTAIPRNSTGILGRNVLGSSPRAVSHHNPNLPGETLV